MNESNISFAKSQVEDCLELNFKYADYQTLAYLFYSSSVCSVSASATRAQCVQVSISASMSMVHAVMVIFLCTIAFAVNRAAFRQGTGPVLLSYLSCTGTESSLLSCSRSGTPSCSHFQDAGVVCPSCKL